MSQVSPFTAMLAYDDAPAALDFLCKAFGFEERFRMAMPDGTIGHAELTFAGSAACFSVATTWKDAGMASPKDLTGVHSQISCDVADVDAHYERALAAGATVIAPPQDEPYGARIYRAVDPEGHRWIFSQTLRELSPKELQALADDS
ncbi:MAG: VOC family protein [Acidobacteriota bacterium]